MTILLQSITTWFTSLSATDQVSVFGILVTLFITGVTSIGWWLIYRNNRPRPPNPNQPLAQPIPTSPSVNPAEPPAKRPRINNLAALPETRGKLFGREDELAELDQAWAAPDTRMVILEAFGGMGNTALLL